MRKNPNESGADDENTEKKILIRLIHRQNLI